LKNLVAYITTGYPEKSFTVDLALALGENGVDTLELGVPFSDPVADGPLIEKRPCCRWSFNRKSKS